MWAEFLANFNGRTIFIAEQWLSSTSLNLFTDASGTLGYGAVLGSSWFYRAWSQQWVNQKITLLELYPIVLAVQIWGNRLANGPIMFYTDNQALVPIINKQSSKDKAIMCLVRKLLITCLRFNILFQAQHIAGKANVSQTTCHVYKSAPSWQKRLWHRGSQKQFPHFLTCQSDNYTCSTDGLRFSTSFTGLLSTGMDLYVQFAQKYSISEQFPVRVSNLALFIAYLASQSYKPSTISSCVSAIGYVHKLKAVPDPTSSFLILRLLRACHKQQKNVDSRMPVVKPMLERLMLTMLHTGTDHYRQHLFQAMFALAFYAFLRIGCNRVYCIHVPGHDPIRREVELDPQLCPEEIMSREVELG